ncbi:uncharacterized protein LOC142587280 isoform X1 [Dermacentor variabilis]|uniref:uncharacterized protein LOC142587280 isoform X1 n=1 Tax=Dermacentor variabilis TaxID=34621 RepID=UPI003F5BD75B
MKCSSVALGLAAAQLVAGLGLTVLPIHTMLKLPSLATRDCPLWAAGPLLCAGIIGIIAVYSNTNYKSQNNRKPIFILKGGVSPFACVGTGVGARLGVDVVLADDRELRTEQPRRRAVLGGRRLLGAARAAVHRPVRAVSRRPDAPAVPVRARRRSRTLLPIRQGDLPAGSQHRQGLILHDGRSVTAWRCVQPVAPDPAVEQPLRVLQCGSALHSGGPAARRPRTVLGGRS